MTLGEIEKALRYHRQNIFCEIDGAKHEKEIVRLKDLAKSFWESRKSKTRQATQDRFMRLME